MAMYEGFNQGKLEKLKNWYRDNESKIKLIGYTSLITLSVAFGCGLCAKSIDDKIKNEYGPRLEDSIKEFNSLGNKRGLEEIYRDR